MDTGSKGKIAEVLVLAELLERGFHVSIPFKDSRYDLVVEKDGIFKRLQIKYVGCSDKRRTIPVVLHSLARRGRLLYSEKEIDHIIVYFAERGEYFILPYEDVSGKTVTYLRLEETGNKQKKGVIYASKYRNRWDLILS